jgi:hypothetical protein
MKIISNASLKSKIIGIILGGIHFCYSWWIILCEIPKSQNDAQWPMMWIVFWNYDWPFSLIHIWSLKYLPSFNVWFLPQGISDFNNFLVPSFVYGILGPLWYFIIPVLISNCISKNKSRE